MTERIPPPSESSPSNADHPTHASKRATRAAALYRAGRLRTGRA